jgi:hypothetical protein
MNRPSSFRFNNRMGAIYASAMRRGFDTAPSFAGDIALMRATRVPNATP